LPGVFGEIHRIAPRRDTWYITAAADQLNIIHPPPAHECLSTIAVPMLDFIDTLATLPGTEAVILIVMLLGGLLILIFTLITGVPPMPTQRLVMPVMFDMIPEGEKPQVVYDLGCGWGRLAFALAARYPDARVIGIELSPLPWLFCKIRQVVQRRPNLEIRYGNFLRMPLGDADLIFCYLMIGAMRRLSAKLTREAKDGTLVIANSFALQDWTPEDIQIVHGAMSAWVYRYRVASDGSHHQVSREKP
jgi:SAM-dependent methyltransferase